MARPDEQTTGAARDVLLQLDKALRVHRLYDRDNEIVEQFAEKLEARLRGFTSQHGELAVNVRPAIFEIGGQKLDMSGIDELALQLFRQGIISLRMTPALCGEELRRFLVLLSEGLRPAERGEDDLVTLLWRSDIEGFHYASVLGYQETGADDEHDLMVDPDAIGETLSEALKTDLAEASSKARVALAAHSERLRGTDLPKPLAEFVAGLSGETTEHLHKHLLALLREVLTLPESGRLLDAGEVGRLLNTVLRLLIDMGQPKTLADFARLSKELAGDESLHHRNTIRAFIDGGLSNDELSRWMTSLPGGPAEHVDVVTTVIQTFADGRKELIAELAAEQAPDSRRALNQVLSDMCGGDAEFLVARFRSLDGAQSADALDTLYQVAPEMARQAVSVRLLGADSETQALLLEAVGKIDGLYDRRVRASLLRLAQRDARLRGMVVATFAQLDDRDVTDTLWEWANSAEFASWDTATVHSLVAALLKLSDEDTVLAFADEVLGRRALLRRKALVTVKLGVIAALGSVATERTLKLLGTHAASGDKAIREVCSETVDEASRQARADNQPKPVLS